MFKKIMAFLLAVVLMLGLLPATVFADSVVGSGNCGAQGNNVTWTLYESGLLELQGTGEMYHTTYTSEYGYMERPWYENRRDITEVVIGDGVTSIGNCAFYDCLNLTSVTLPESITKIGYEAFYCCRSLPSLTLPSGVTNIGDRAFLLCESITGLNLPEGITEIGVEVFGGCHSLESIALPEGLTSIGDWAFQECRSLHTIHIPGKVASIGYKALCVGHPNYTDAAKLGSITVSPENAYFTSIDGVLFDKSCSTLVCYPAGKGGSYTVPYGVSQIEHDAFSDAREMTDISIPSTVTSIGGWAFYNAKGLTKITIPNGVTSLSGYIFSGCSNLSEVVLPKNMTAISTSVFSGCTKLESIILPEKLTELERYALSGSALRSITFCSDAPVIGEKAFSNLTATAYYPEGNDTWTQDVMLDYDGWITWVPYAYESTEETDSPCTLYELETLDYLAFANLAYAEALSTKPVGITVEQLLARSPDLAEDWGTIPNNAYEHADLFSEILTWRVHKVWEYDNGFLAVAFVNNNGEAVLAYRGSENPMDIFDYLEGDWDAFDDWIVNDLPMELGNQVGTQFQDVIDVYDELHDSFATEDIVTTGHSLGGAWGDVASAYSGCKAVTFNAVSALDAVYDQKAHVMSKSFDGVDRWSITDHINEHDILAGAFEEQFFTERIKPYIAYESLYGKDDFSDLGNNHSLKSIITVSEEGNPCLTARFTSFQPYARISHKLTRVGFGSTILDLGTSGGDTFHAGTNTLTPRTSYGGSSSDQITTGSKADTLVGGEGGDVLDGSYHDDTYIYWKGDGLDTIHDISGDDALWLYGFGEDDEIQVSENEDDEYIWITCNSERIVGISKKNRTYWLGLLNTKSFKVYVDHGSGSPTEFDITEYFNEFRSGSRLLVSCPVHVEVLDPNGNVVYTLTDGEVGNHYTDYGTFYVFEEETGEYGKVLDLAEGYTARIVGAGEGTMDVTYQVPMDGELTDPVSVADVPVTESLIAAVETRETGDIRLIIDADGDGDPDSTRQLYVENPFTDVKEGKFYHEPVLWAVTKEITSGVTDTTFVPEGECTRGQVVTFLWRAAGSPEPTVTAHPFTDVKEGAYYYKAMLWAVENGITKGTTATTFGPGKPCNRGQVVTFLHRAKGKPAPTSTEHPFTDVTEGKFYYDAMLWAVENGITSGMTKTTFAPNNICTRGQVVTFLYRTYVN